MQAAAARTKEHQVVYCGLEVLRLIGERIESRDEVDREDLRVVLEFMRDVAHRCLDNTEDILNFASLDQQLASHRRVRSLFEELARTEGPDFATACRLYTDILSQSILEDRRCLAALDCDPETLGQFYEWERETDALSRQHGQTLHRLEMKYTNPHCI
jgi:archaellum biogenesis protein FlaJ (TadC family)